MVACGIPVLDLEEVSRRPEKMVEALERWGCFRLINHGIPPKLMSDMKATVLSLFDLPLEVKRRNAYPEPFMGYIPIDVSGSSVTELMGVFDMANPNAVDVYCDQLDASPHQRKTMAKYSEAVTALSQELGRKIKEGYSLEEEGDLFEGWSGHLRLLRYCNNEQTLETVVGPIHADKSFLTLLRDDEMVDGLEFLEERTGEWYPVHPLPGALLLNAGDIAKAWRNGRFCNVKHRVQFREAKVRVSVAYFVLAPRDAKVDAPPKLVDSEHLQLYVPFELKEYQKFSFSSSKSAKGGALDSFLRAAEN